MNKIIYNTFWLALATVLVMSSPVAAQCYSREGSNLTNLEDSFAQAASEKAKNNTTALSPDAAKIAAGPALDDPCIPGSTKARQAYYGNGLPKDAE